jgi:hypothetical protein
MRWLEAVEEVARAAAFREARQRTGTVEVDAEPVFSYRWEHVQQVVKNAEWLLSKTEADPDIVLAACWLHDVKKGEENHARRGADFARSFLPSTGFPRAKIESVAAAIEQHEGLWRADPDWEEDGGLPFRAAPPIEPIEAAVVWDADKLSKMGPVSLLHFLPLQILEQQQTGRRLTTEAIIERNREWLDTVAPRMLASFNTLAAQQKALQLHSAFEIFWQAAEESIRPGAAFHDLPEPLATKA